MQVHVIYN